MLKNIIRFIFWSLIIITLGVMFFVLEEKLWTRAQAYKIIDALEQYKNDNGVYPESLKKLPPTYLKRVPASKLFGRDDFFYKRGCEDQCHEYVSDPMTYVLDYHRFSFFHPRYVPSTKQWSMAPFVD
ncbi:MAG: hypothetical protein ACI9F2_000998 [Lysobacterales bacterium]|jgi:hypothetical protein